MSSYLRNLKSLSHLIRELEDNRDFRRFCGFGNTLPRKMTFYRFQHRLDDHWGYVRQMFVQLTDEAHSYLPDLGDQVAIDSTFVRAYGNPNRKSRIDPDAKWGYKNDARAFKGEKQRAYGYKMHTLSDANHELPLATITIPANRHDSTQLQPLVELSEDLYSWFKPSILIGDKAYDGTKSSAYLMDKGIVPVTDIRKTTAHDGMYNGVYGRDGTPTCLGNIPMEYVRTDPANGHHLFRCAGCHLKNSMRGGIRHCDTEVWEDPRDNPRVLTQIMRGTPEWKKTYAKRQAIERSFKSMKQSVRLEEHSARDLEQVTLHTLMVILAYQSKSVSKLRSGKKSEMRSMVRQVA